MQMNETWSILRLAGFAFIALDLLGTSGIRGRMVISPCCGGVDHWRGIDEPRPQEVSMRYSSGVTREQEASPEVSPMPRLYGPRYVLGFGRNARYLDPHEPVHELRASDGPCPQGLDGQPSALPGLTSVRRWLTQSSAETQCRTPVRRPK